jgi:hypothetical protein
LKEEKPKNTSESNTFSFMSMILGGIAFILFPPLFGGVGIILAVFAKTKNEKLWSIGLTMSIVGTVIGGFYGYILGSG